MFYDKEAYNVLKKCAQKNDIEEWSEYRKKHKNASISMRFANLRYFYLQDADLTNIDFRGANLEGANLEGADVENANISIGWLIQLYFFVLSSFALVIGFLYYQELISQNLLESLLRDGDILGVGVVSSWMFSQQAIANAKNPHLAIGFN